MFGFHRRSRSLIPVGDLEKLEKQDDRLMIRLVEEELEDDTHSLHTQSPRHVRDLAMVYLLFLAEAVMAASLSSQVAVLLPSDVGCLTMDTAYLRSILECAYSFGSAMGVLWGWTTDRWGRRSIALAGLAAMSVCCLCMGFAKTFVVFAALRFVAGAVGSAVSVAGMTMLADLTYGSKDRVAIVARLPLVVACGCVGPFVANAIHAALESQGFQLLEDYPGLASQIACASLVIAITICETLLLRETLPEDSITALSPDGADMDYEKLSFLSTAGNDSSNALDVLEPTGSRRASLPMTSRISTSQMMSAPAIAVLLTSFSVLSLHSSTFDLLLPHLGHLASDDGGMGVSCSWLDLVILAVKIAAAVRVMTYIPSVVTKDGVLAPYRRISLWFPAIYVAIPVVGVLVAQQGAIPLVSVLISCAAMLCKATLAGSAWVLVLLLVLCAAPDATSTGTVIGVVYVSEFCRALAVGIGGISYYLSDDYSLVALNGALWGTLVAIAAVGAALTWKLREKPRVGTDIPEECLVWEDMFDSESDKTQT